MEIPAADRPQLFRHYNTIYSRIIFLFIISLSCISLKFLIGSLGSTKFFIEKTINHWPKLQFNYKRLCLLMLPGTFYPAT